MTTTGICVLRPETGESLQSSLLAWARTYNWYVPVVLGALMTMVVFLLPLLPL
jgi:hypothetical protein